jgi:hypothetical protein
MREYEQKPTPIYFFIFILTQVNNFIDSLQKGKHF